MADFDIDAMLEATAIDTIATNTALIKTYKQVFSFDNNALIALHTTPQVLVAAPGANKLAAYQYAYIRTNFQSAYSNIHASGHTEIAWDASPDQAVSAEFANDAGEGLSGHTSLWTQTGSVVWPVPPNFGLFNVNRAWAQVYDFWSSAAIFDAPLIFKTSNGSNFTGGHANNILQLALRWDIVDFN